MSTTIDLPQEVLAVGRLIGLLDDTAGKHATVVDDWFRDPASYLGRIGTRLGQLGGLIDATLGPGAPDPPAVFDGAAWYPIPTPSMGTTTAIHVVISPPGAATGQIGIGLYAPSALGRLVIEPYAYVPLFGYDATGAHFAPGSNSDPAQVGVTLRSSTPFGVDGVSFAALHARGRIFLADQAPTFELSFDDLKGTSKPARYDGLAALLDPDVLSWIAAVIPQATPWLSLYPGNSPHTVGEILVAAGFLKGSIKDGYTLVLADLRGKSALDIALNFVFAAVDAVADLGDPLVALPGGGVYVEHDKSTGDYGMRVAGQLSIGDEPPANGSGPPVVDLCLGTWFSGETAADNWSQHTTGTSTDPGMSLLMLNRKDSGPITFAPGFAFTSVGVNVRGSGDAPLVDIDGYTLGGAELRASLAYEQHGWTYGAAARLDAVGFPLGPGFEDARHGDTGTNVVASNLLSSGGASSGDDKKPSAVNPAFSAEAAYVAGHKPMFEVLDPSGARTDVVWIPVQRRFGPLACKKIGVKIDGSTVAMLFDGSVLLAALTVDLDELSIGVDLENPGDVSEYKLDLQGLEVTFAGGGVEISGGLQKVQHKDAPPSYDGEALIKAESFALGAIGSFGSLPGGGTSLFVFAWLDAPIGGPPFFCITGVAAGFGFNRALKIPEQNEVQAFPLLAALTDPSKIGADPAKPNVAPAPQDALATLEDWVPAQRGEYWLAAGLQFTTFEIINSNALLIVEFGHDFVVAVLGIATIKQPAIGDAYVYAELDLEVVFRPLDGELRASAVLAPSSYVLTPEAHLTGGFAFCAWFGDHTNAGDFVFTIGGYHPAFTAPDHYPQEPRVGIDWRVSDSVALVGGAYFAITPAAMMAGGGLELTFSAGPLKAWFKAHIDVLLSWKPFYLIADASISIGVSFHLQFLFIDATLSIELSAHLTLFGPPIGFLVHVDWYVISFTITHGELTPAAPQLSWDEFKGLLPTKAAAPNAKRAAAALDAPAPARTAAYVTVVANDGLVSQKAVGHLTHWLVRPGQLRFEIASAVPASAIVVDSAADGDDRRFDGDPVAMRGVGGGIAAKDYHSTQTIAILELGSDGGEARVLGCALAPDAGDVRPAGCSAPVVDPRRWHVEKLRRPLPQAMWGDPVPASEKPPLNADAPTVVGSVGVTMTPAQLPITNGTPQMVISTVFADRTVNSGHTDRLPISPAQKPPGVRPHAADSFADIAHVNTTPGPAGARAALFAALGVLGFNGWTNDPLPHMAADPGSDFADEPMVGSTIAAT